MDVEGGLRKEAAGLRSKEWIPADVDENKARG